MDISSRRVPPLADPEYVRPPDDAYDLSPNPKHRQHQAVNHVLTNELVRRITGRGDEKNTLYGTPPDDQYFAGVLASQIKYRRSQEDETPFQNIGREVAPFSLGLRFRVPDTVDESERVEIKPEMSGYYRRFPTLDEQRKYENSSGIEDNLDQFKEREVSAESEGEEPDEEVDEEPTRARQSDEKDLLEVYEEVEINCSPIVLTGAEIPKLAKSGDEELFKFTDSIEQAYKEYRKDPLRMREKRSDVSKEDARTLLPQSLEDEDAFNEFIDDHYEQTTLDPLWEFELSVEVREVEDADAYSVTLSLTNTHGRDYPDVDDPERDQWRAQLFDAKISTDVEGTTTVPFESDELEHEYQYDSTIHAVGENCTVDITFDSDNDNTSISTISTETVPVYEQLKYRPRETTPIPIPVLAGQESPEYPDLTRDDVLTSISNEMSRALTHYEDVREDVLENKSPQAREKFDEAVESFEIEQRRFDKGIELIRHDEHAQEAFKLLNQTFSTLFDEWRLFQIVYIVMAIPDVVAQANPESVDYHHLDDADIIYYPTGGGKTEAYVGVVVFTAFHDRLRGKDYGTTALTKFPLRFLSLQQLQRIADALGQAELLRRDHEEIGDSEPFSIGYFVGQRNSPNKIIQGSNDGPDDNNARRARDDDDAKRDWRFVSKCPFCQEKSVEVTGDTDAQRIIHQCTNPDCDEVKRNGGDSAPLPIYVTDEEIYRYAPTFVVSTIDKIAIVGMQRRFRTIFGRIKKRCPVHGYSGEQHCLARYCDEDIEDVSATDPPSILIQDELHLLREEFGAFDAHYETFLQEWIRQTTDGQWQMKVIAATATIKGAERQVNALYRKKANRFPSNGPRLRQSFYAYDDPHNIGRRMIGALPRSVSRTYAINKVHEEYARIIQDYQRDPLELASAIEEEDLTYDYDELDFPNDEDELVEKLREILDNYEVQISYHHSKDNTDLVRRSVRTMINQNLAAEQGRYERIVAELLTGETPLGDVSDVLARLEREEPGLDPVHMVIATSMISHGVDIDRFNFIAFFGFPRQTAEYIQSYSRVGRDVPGTTFVLYDPVRVRDQSFYHRFQHYHEYQDMLVEGTPLERWAQFALECTLPGIFAGALVQHYDYENQDALSEGRIYNYEGLQEAIRKDILKRDDLMEFVRNAYDVRTDSTDPDDVGVELYRSRIDDEFLKIWERVLQKPESNHFTDKFISGLIKRSDEHRGVMRSLRDIDEQVPITPDSPTSSIIHYFRE